MERRGGGGAVEGVLLYAGVGDDVDEAYLIDGFPIRVFALNLAQEWRGIEGDLLGLLGDRRGSLQAR